MNKSYELSPAQLALAQARKEKKRLAEALSAAVTPTPSALLQRPWLDVLKNTTSICTTKILTWNILAQCLVRRTLFPTSDCLKGAQRYSLIEQEIQRQDAHIICLQEVDQLDKLLPMLEKAGYSAHYASGRLKKHGCLIGFKKDLYTFVSDKIIYYDEEHVGSSGRIGASFATKNIGYMMAIRSKANESEGITVATTHLFWHPKYTYERIRQTAILFRELVSFRDSQSAQKWPCIAAGDFNFGPTDPAYSLLTGDALLPTQEEAISQSMVVHASIDPSIRKDTPAANVAKEDDEGDTVDPDRVITNARVANDSDGLLHAKEIVDWFSDLPTVASVYADGLCEVRRQGGNIARYGDRVTLPAGRHGEHEPEYTSYTHFWQAVLDYIFVLEPTQRHVQVKGILAPLSGEDMSPGLPQKRVSGSDHTCLVAELIW